MSTLSYALSDSRTMLRRNLLHARRYPSMTVSVITMPIVVLLLFVYIFGGALSAGLAGVPGSHGSYIDYVLPGILLMTAGSGAVPTAVAVCTDMAEGIIGRFRTMAISRASVLTGHVVGSTIQTMLSLALVTAVAVLMGFRSSTGPADWAAAVAILALLVVALTWLSVALGLVVRAPEAASNVTLPFSFLLPFVSSAFVPLDSLPSWIRWFAEYQPFTTVIETLRGLLLGTPIGDNAWLAVAWCSAIAVGGYLWARTVYRREPVRFRPGP